MGNVILSNVVNKKVLRKVQLETLQDIASYLKTSFGPFGSNTIIKRDNDANTEYTKDGHDILSQIKYNGPIETTIIDDLVDITKYVVKKVGDGTTSAVEMANFVFKGIANIEAKGKYSAYDIIFAFNKIIDKISKTIKSNGKQCTLEDIYDIAYTSTNGNERLAENIYTLYKDYGFDIYIDLQVALTSNEDIIKVYDGMNMDEGYVESTYVNKPNAICELHNPRIYIFDDPVDTPEMIRLFDKIIHDNIIIPYSQPINCNEECAAIPTVIMAPVISADMSAYMTSLNDFIMKFPMNAKPPIVIIKTYTHQESMSDIATMCGAPKIKKYINDEIQQLDIEKGLAPTLDTITNFYGTCDMISVSKDSTKIIRPAKMYNEDGSYTEEFNSLLSWCENELEREKGENKNSTAAYNLKKRINSLKANLIEYFVGGISVSDRDNNRALLEDAIKNCRSAIADGVGSGGNVEGFRVIYDLMDQITDGSSPTEDFTELEKDIICVIDGAYINIINLLYDKTEKDSFFYKNLINNGAYNLRTNKFDGKVKTSILSDIVILEAIAKIITRMATAEQFILPSPVYNVYMDDEDK